LSPANGISGFMLAFSIKVFCVGLEGLFKFISNSSSGITLGEPNEVS